VERKNKTKAYLLRAFISSIALLCAGCSTLVGSRYQKKEIMRHYAAGDYDKADEAVDEMVGYRTGTGDELMWHLENGSVSFAAGDYRESLESFDAEIGSAFTNPNAIPYKGYYYEKILIHAYKAMIYYSLGDPEAAAVELRNARYQQKIAEEYFEERVLNEEYAMESATTSCPGFSSSEIINDDRIQKNMSQLKEAARVRASFVNPFVTYLSAVSYLSRSNYQDALIDFRNMYDMELKNDLVSRSYRHCANKTAGIRVPPELNNFSPYPFPLDRKCVYVIFENGLCAAKKEKLVEFYLPPPVGYLGLAYPELEYFPADVESMKVLDSNGNTLSKTVKISDMDSIVSRSLQEEFSAIIARVLVGLITKEATSIALQEAARNIPRVGEGARLAVFIAMNIYKKAFNRADTRCWQALPKEYQAAHFPKPDDGMLTFSSVMKGQSVASPVSTSIKLEKNDSLVIVYVKSNGFNSMSIKIMEIEDDF
jgi:hypothetical protein